MRFELRNRTSRFCLYPATSRNRSNRVIAASRERFSCPNRSTSNNLPPKFAKRSRRSGGGIARRCRPRLLSIIAAALRLPRVIRFKDIQAARDRISGAVFHSDCRESIPLSEISGAQIFCKFENAQRTGSFKERGACNALYLLSSDQKKRGVIAASAGNHAQALAYQGKLLGIPATVVMPQYATLIK